MVLLLILHTVQVVSLTNLLYLMEVAVKLHLQVQYLQAIQVLLIRFGLNYQMLLVVVIKLFLVLILM